MTVAKRCRIAAVPLLVAAEGSRAHAQGGGTAAALLDAGLLLALVMATATYMLGSARAPSPGGRSHGLDAWRCACGLGGLGALAAALLSPLEALAERAFSLHMVQHLLLLFVAPPLIVFGRPHLALLWAAPRRYRAQFARLGHRLRRWLSGRRGCGLPWFVGLVTVTLWLWHVPALYELALHDPVVHALEHASFVLGSLLFWAAVLHEGGRAGAAAGARILALWALAVQGSLLGTLITFSTSTLYASYLATNPVSGLTPLADQQLAGLLMWIPPGFGFTVATAWLFVRWLHMVGRRADLAYASNARAGRDRAVP